MSTRTILRCTSCIEEERWRNLVGDSLGYLPFLLDMIVSVLFSGNVIMLLAILRWICGFYPYMYQNNNTIYEKSNSFVMFDKSFLRPTERANDLTLSRWTGMTTRVGRCCICPRNVAYPVLHWKAIKLEATLENNVWTFFILHILTNFNSRDKNYIQNSNTDLKICYLFKRAVNIL